jgi:hypothetical protein
MSTGTVAYGGASFSDAMNEAISTITNAGTIKLGIGTFVVSSEIATGDKSIVIEGSGWGRGSPITSNPGTLITSDASGYIYLLKFGVHSSATQGAGIRNCMLTVTNNECYGAIYLYNTINCFIENCYIYANQSFPFVAKAIMINGASDETVGGWNNRVINNFITWSYIGVYLGVNANYCLIHGNKITGVGIFEDSYAIKCEGESAPIPSPVGCIIQQNHVSNYTTSGSKALYVTEKSDYAGYHIVQGNNFSDATVNIQINSGTGIGGCTFTGNIATGTIVDNGNVTSNYY